MYQRHPPFQVYAEPRLISNSIAMYLHRKVGDRVEFWLPIIPTIRSEEEGATSAADQGASLDIPKETVIELMTELWRIGIRPRDLPPVGGGELRAMAEHLEDLRRLVFRLDVQPRVGAP